MRETTDVWTRLSSESKPIVMYGTGNGADKILDVLYSRGINVSDIFVSDAFFRGQSFRGFDVIRYSDVVSKYDDCIILLAFAIFRDDMMNFVKEIQQRYEVLAPEFPVFGTDYFTNESVLLYHDQICQMHEMLADDTSLYVFEDLLDYRISGKLSYLMHSETPREEVFENIIRLSSYEDYVDLGAYDGDTIREFLEMTGGRYNSIIALEPDEKNFKKLQRTAESLSLKNTEIYNLASWSEQRVMSFDGGGGRNSSLNTGSRIAHASDVDSVLKGRRSTYIKMDVEGAEEETLRGLQKTLRQYKPKLAVSAYHHTGDLFTLPETILSINPDYKVFLRHHPYIPAWETNLYCV